MSPRIQLAALMAVLGVGILFWAFYRPEARRTEARTATDAPKPAPKPQVVARPVKPVAPELAKAQPKPTPEVAPEVEPDEAPEPTPEAEEEEGPFEVTLGKHVLFLSDPDRGPKEGRVARTEVILIVPEQEGRTEIRHRRSQLVRMLYFLATRRNADAARSAAGKRRFEADFLERINNVMHASVLDVRFEGYAVGARPEAASFSEARPQ